ncbi:COG1361 family protein [Clostridium sp. DL1XJH146]
MNFFKKLSFFAIIFLMIFSFNAFAMDGLSMSIASTATGQLPITSNMDSNIESASSTAPNFKIYIDKVSTDPENINPGSEFKIKITLKNIGSKDLENVVLKMDSVEGKNILEGFSPINTTNEILYGDIKKGESTEKEISFLAAPNVNVGLYNLNVKLFYKEKYGDEYEESRLIGVLIKNNSSLSVTNFTTNTGFTEEDSSDDTDFSEWNRGLNVEFVNSGKGELRNLMFTVKTDNYEYTKYYGSLEQGEEDYIDLELSYPEEISGALTISYEDELGNTDEIEKTFTLDALSQEITAAPEENKGILGKIGSFFKSLFGLN